MFFRRRKPVSPTFADRLRQLEAAGFTVERASDGKAAVLRGGFAGLVEEAPGAGARVVRAGLVIGREAADLVDLGYQKIWRTPRGVREPATAPELAALHRFLEDLRESLGLVSLYNESLGTVNGRHDYDRVKGREPESAPPAAH
jgi:hypothetical protein